MRNIQSNQIAEVKKEIEAIYPVIQALLIVWPSDKLTMISVLVQNMCFYSPYASNALSLDEEYEHMKDILKALKMVANHYSLDHTANWIYQEVNMVWDGYWMSVDEELEQIVQAE